MTVRFHSICDGKEAVQDVSGSEEGSTLDDRQGDSVGKEMGAARLGNYGQTSLKSYQGWTSRHANTTPPKIHMSTTA